MQQEKNVESTKPPFSSRLKSVPSALGIRLENEPNYISLYEDESFEVREYGPMVIASLKIDSSLEEFRSEAFTRLTAYLFANEIEMTAPVLVQRCVDGWEMQFILPERYGFMTAPQPQDEDIKINAIPSRRVALCRYTGANTKDRMTFAIYRLQACLREHPRYVANSPIWWAHYDPPYTVSFLKRNEVQVEVTEIWPQ